MRNVYCLLKYLEMVFKLVSPGMSMQPISKYGLVFLLVLTCSSLKAQEIQTPAKPSMEDTATLENLVIKAFAYNTKWKNIPAAVAVLNEKDLQRLGNSSLLPAFNMVPGVRMEERSPGSYRLSVRGSLLRSPFGIRNVKAYWNNIPLTDAGGNTYLNLIDVNQVAAIEIAKGPAASLYGANTGGAVLITSKMPNNNQPENSFKAGISGGSFGLVKEYINWQYQKDNFKSSLQQSHMQSDGYRQQSALRRDVLQWTGSLQLNEKELLSALAFYTDLHYETPGAITKAQMDSLPTLARQPSSTLPGAVQQKTGVYNKTVFGAINLVSAFSNHFDNTTSLLLNHTNFKNPFITNFEMRDELNYGGRTVFDWHKKAGDIDFHFQNGIEWLQNHSKINVFGNKAGMADTVQYKDDLYATQYFIFSQFVASIKNKWVLQAGVSANRQQLKYARLSTMAAAVYQQQETKFLLAPRLSILYKVQPDFSIYALVSKGFSPPTLSEIRPSTGSFYNLQPEYGWNFEAGFKGTLLKGQLQFDINAYSFDLQQAIVRKTDSTGADYFTNAGGTKQRGIEFWIKGNLINNSNGVIRKLVLAHNFSYQPYTFNQYILGSKDFSGNDVTGVPKNINVSSLDLDTRWNIYTHIAFNATAAIPLTDANDVYAKAYQLLQIKAGYILPFKKLSVDFFAGIDNALNQVYSLGNDINGFGGRYYNPAPKRNYFAGVDIRL